MNDFLTHINIPFNQSKLLEEFNSSVLEPYTPSRKTKGSSWFSYQPDWMTSTIDDYKFYPELDKIKDYIISVFGFEPIGKLFKLTEGVEVPPHKDMGHKCCINIVLSDDPAPVFYKDYGEIQYQCAILNVVKRHSVKAGPERKMIKFQLGDMYYKEAVETWNTKHSLT